MIDTHAHIDTTAFDDDRFDMLARAWENGVTAVIIPAIEIKDFDRLQQLVESDSRLYRGAGIHPHHVADVTDSDLQLVEDESKRSKVVAIGEIGLDYYYDFAPKDIQQAVFRQQLQIAKRTDKPVIIHNRDSDNDILRILGEEQDGTLRGVLHCFSSSVEILDDVLALGMHVSFTGNITFKKSLLDGIVARVPDDRFMIETDSPYITPVPFRGKRNEPVYIRHIAEAIARIRLTSFESIVTMTTTTAQNLFRLILLTGITLCIAISGESVLFAQSQDSPEYEIVDELVHPYAKTLGVGFIIAPNTIIDNVTLNATGKPRSISYDGVLSFGGMANYAISDHVTFEAACIYSNNTRITLSPYFQTFPNTHFIIESVGRFIANPYSRVSFFGTLGGSYIANNYNNGADVNQVFGIVAGIGFFVNIKTPIGLICPTAEWRLNYFASKRANFDANGVENGKISTYFSIPRLTIIFHPNL